MGINTSRNITCSTARTIPSPSGKNSTQISTCRPRGFNTPIRQAFNGYIWYRTTIDLTASQAKKNVHAQFPGIFAESWIYVNGQLVDYHPQNPMWWRNDYSFRWDVDLTGKLQPGENLVVVRNHNLHHVGGMFHRPFLYLPTEKS
ncbi:MAG: hypothetical protein CMJ81_21480 [Planctomycetaceae bacterium]|nr:hypothetical protein [Planctomycetaceae bacterium]